MNKSYKKSSFGRYNKNTMPKLVSGFIRKTENFTCGICGLTVVGDGYTNHCPDCLWSKHVDVFPGDRKSECLGMMEPTGVTKKGKDYSILHKCIKCGFEKPNKAVKDDNFDMLVQISASSLSK